MPLEFAEGAISFNPQPNGEELEYAPQDAASGPQQVSDSRWAA